MPRPLPVWHLAPPSVDSRVLVFVGNELIGSDPAVTMPMLSYAETAQMGRPEMSPLLIGHWQGEDIYAVALDQVSDHYPRRTLRSILASDDAEFAALVSTAVQLLAWQRDHRHCGRCGAATRLLEKERAFYCDRCRHRFFPRLSPCVIVAIRKGPQVLLAQAHLYAGKLYSLIAGFVEPGESAEEAVHREVHEETGLEVTNLRYVESQPWAFPHQLMLGFVADYKAGRLVLDQQELATADWFDARSLPTVPGEWTIAGRLIRVALEAGTA